MAIHSVHDYSLLINQQVVNKEKLNTILSKVNSLIFVASHDNCLQCPKSITHDYLWVMSDLVAQAIQLNSDSLDSLLETSSM